VARGRNKLFFTMAVAAVMIDDGDGVELDAGDPLLVSQEFLNCFDLPETQADG